MILPREYYSRYISDRLSILAVIIKARTRAEDTSANVVLETIVEHLFNALFGWKLKNLNETKRNYQAVDLADTKRRLAIQVTNQDRGSKITGTVKKFLRHNLASEYDRLLIFFLLEKKPHLPKALVHAHRKPRIDTWDIADLLRRVRNLSSLQALKRAASVLKRELGDLDAPQPRRPRGRRKPLAPKLIAKFQVDEDGDLCKVGRGKLPEYCIYLGVEGAPPRTTSVRFNILDDTFADNPWTLRRNQGPVRSALDYLTDDMRSYGDVAVVVEGRSAAGAKLWSIESTLYEALIRFYGDRVVNRKVRRALNQIKAN
ncbi:MAG TPA: SMEK domain-containing protein [Lacunisphaera sp.]|nr:SMEK domain-containing protein [Lacunisphaera sp.]